MNDSINIAKRQTRKGIPQGILAVIIMLAAALIMTVVLLTLAQPSLPGSAGAANSYSFESELAVHDNFYVFSGDKIGFSFLYPKDRTVEYDPLDGAYIYPYETGSAPYVLVCRMDKAGMSTQAYFAQCDRLMQDSFESVESTPIYQVTMGDKQLYLVRYVCDGYVIDRYFEPYSSFYMQYTAVSDEGGSLDTELYYAITTLRANDGAYVGSYSPKVSRHSLDDIGISMDIPDMLNTLELTIGFLANSDDGILLAVHMTSDDNGKPIYNRQDFIDRAAESPEFVAALLGADEATFTEGEQKVLNGKDYYCYPMNMTEGGISFKGEICLTNAAETGCWVVAYAAREGSAAFDSILKLLSQCVSGITVR